MILGPKQIIMIAVSNYINEDELMDIPEMLTPVTRHTDPITGFGSSKLMA